MIFDTTLLERNKQYQYKKQVLIYSHSSLNARGGKNFIFRTVRGAWKRLDRNQLDHVYAVEHLRSWIYGVKKTVYLYAVLRIEERSHRLPIGCDRPVSALKASKHTFQGSQKWHAH